jgi:glycosyltransferase involved in cell wall biosynthesis
MRVAVLMSTYNGEKFIDEQIVSILKQLPAEGLLMVRDDGSTDKTVEKIRRMKDTRIQIEIGENIGFAKSFLTLLNETPRDREMVMFADQDDVWLDGKIQRAWDSLATSEGQASLYCSGQLITDEKLNILESSERITHQPSFRNAIAENIVTGCTAAINNQALQLMLRSGVPKHVQFHDWWLYLVISAHGKVIVDEKAFILYRQHENNYIGRGTGWAGRILKKIRYLKKESWTSALIGQVIDLREYYWLSLSAGDRKIIEQYVEGVGADVRVRWRFICSRHLWTSSISRDLVLRWLLMRHRKSSRMI